VAAALADLAAEERWVRPVVDASRALMIEGGRHAVVEAALRRQGKPFVANACDLSAAPLLVVTGPNMGGKSTFLRQVALLAILAQAGSFVPAASARIGLVSRVFSRVGASDDLARGRSTFMVEMVETAAILNEADDRALVILDEIGRGTGHLGRASASPGPCLEHLHDATRCRALFATHFHEVAGVAERLPGAANAHLGRRRLGG
jgi:DNA mismatch repair protein MutS